MRFEAEPVGSELAGYLPGMGGTRSIGLIGAPSSAGAYSPGQEQAPAAMRDAGLIDRLREHGREVVDLGDTPRFRWRPDREEPMAMNADHVRDTALEVARRVEHAIDAELLPVVIGGDCTVGIGTLAGWRARRGEAPLVYVDPHPDLNTPDSAPDGAFDWMGVAHMLRLEGSDPRVGEIAAEPLLDADDVLIVGYAPERATEAERARIGELGIATITDTELRADAAAGARRALDWAGSRSERFVVHLDTDSIDFADLPLAENTDRNVGPSFAMIQRLVEPLLSSPRLGALTITEINPAHGEPGGETLRAFIDWLAKPLGGGGRA